MAPKRKPVKDSPADVAAPSRATRSSTRLANAAVAPPAEEPKKKKAKITTKAQSPPSPVEKEAETGVNGSKTIVIEHCKQCNAFKTRAFQVKEAVEKGVAGVKVLVNPEKPRRGCFEIREEGGEVFVSLVDMKRPFPPLKALNMDELISQILHKIQ